MRKLLLFVVVFLALTCNVIAAKTLSANRVIINTPVDDNLAIAGGEVTISNKINGDLLCAGGRLMIDSMINGDIICMGGDVAINREVAGDVRVAGGNVVIGARVSGDLIVAGGSVLVKDSSVIGKDVIISGGNVVFLGSVLRNVDIKGGNVVYGGASAKNVFIDARKITFEKGSHVAGNLTYSSRADVDTSKVSVRGSIFKKVPPLRPRYDIYRAFLIGRLIAYLALLVIGLIIFAMIPRYTEMVANTFGASFWKSFGYGLLVLILSPILIVLLLLTIIGIPVALIGCALYIILLYIAKLAAAFWMAEKFGKGEMALRMLFFILSLLIVYVVVSIPIVGWLVNLVVIIAGAGALIIAAYMMLKSAKQARKR